MAQITTSAENFTYHFEDSEQVFPCRCGETHRGQDAIHRHMEHECLHDDKLVMFYGGVAYCCQCGSAWEVIMATEDDFEDEDGQGC